MESAVDESEIAVSECNLKSGLGDSNFGEDFENLYSQRSYLNLEEDDLLGDEDLGDGVTPFAAFLQENALNNQEGTLKIFDQRFDALKEDFKKRMRSLAASPSRRSSRAMEGP